jgi:hypothetical protein
MFPGFFRQGADLEDPKYLAWKRRTFFVVTRSLLVMGVRVGALTEARHAGRALHSFIRSGLLAVPSVSELVVLALRRPPVKGLDTSYRDICPFPGCDRLGRLALRPSAKTG